jgi:hypothetical protein
MRSCCKQVREFVDFGKHLHARISELYDELNEKAELERVKMLLEYLSRHEHHLEQTLLRYEKEVHGGILEAWLEYSPTLDVDAVMEASQLPENPSTDDIFAAALAFDDTLVKLYREVAEKAHDPHTRALFQDLLQLEEQEKIQVTRAAMSLRDM